jgi:hypothetical protein
VDFGGYLRSVGLANRNFIRSQGQAGALSIIQAIARERQNRANLAAEKTGLVGEQAAFEQDQEGRLAAAQDKADMDRALAESIIGKRQADTVLGQERIDTTQRGQDITAGTQRRGQSITAREQTLSHADRVRKMQQDRARDAYQRAHHLGPYKLPAPRTGRTRSTGGRGGGGPAGTGQPRASDQAFAQKFQHTVNNLAYGRAHGWSDAQMRANQRRAGVSNEVISAAFQVLNSGGTISPAGYSYITRNLGVRVSRGGWSVPRYGPARGRSFRSYVR